MHSCIFEGWVRHQRLAPVEHGFRYGLYLIYLDLSELTEVFRGSWLWSTGRPSVAWFRRGDHLGDHRTPLDEAVRDLVAASGRARPLGPIRLLTHLRYFGYVMNPVSFYYCFDRSGERLETVVAEVNNTPWGEQHCYVLDKAQFSGDQRDRKLTKEFHVSPFLPMDLWYHWRLSPPGERLQVHLAAMREESCVLDVCMQLRRRELSPASRSRVLLRYPWMTGRVIMAIYWQALRLWWKRCPFHPHPRKIARAAKRPADALRM